MLYLPSNYHPNSNITNDSIIILNLLEIKIYLKEQCRLVNLVRLKLQVIFISDLLEPGSNKVKECYLKEKNDKFN